ncbi:hypothetical protein BH09SUM1_BH09SUM1_33760 [soil metagenome]
MTKIDVHSENGDLATMLDLAERGESVEISRDGRIVATLLPSSMPSENQTAEKRERAAQAVQNLLERRERLRAQGLISTLEENLRDRDAGRR